MIEDATLGWVILWAMTGKCIYNKIIISKAVQKPAFDKV